MITIQKIYKAIQKGLNESLTSLSIDDFDDFDFSSSNEKESHEEIETTNYESNVYGANIIDIMAQCAGALWMPILKKEDSVRMISLSSIGKVQIYEDEYKMAQALEISAILTASGWISGPTAASYKNGDFFEKLRQVNPMIEKIGRELIQYDIDTYGSAFTESPAISYSDSCGVIGYMSKRKNGNYLFILCPTGLVNYRNIPNVRELATNNKLPINKLLRKCHMENPYTKYGWIPKIGINGELYYELKFNKAWNFDKDSNELTVGYKNYTYKNFINNHYVVMKHDNDHISSAYHEVIKCLDPTASEDFIGYGYFSVYEPNAPITNDPVLSFMYIKSRDGVGTCRVYCYKKV